MKFLKLSIFTLTVALAFFSALAVSAEYQEGKHYRVLENPGIPSEPGKVEVREFFWYGCPHCFKLEGALDSWKKSLPDDVSFVPTPAVSAPHWKVLGNAYYAAESLGIADKGHKAMFKALHVDRQRYNTPAQVAEFYAQFGATEQEFMDKMNSFSVKTAMRRSDNLFRQYQLTGVPALIVNGKYQVVGANYAEMLKITDYLISKERKATLQGAAE